MQTQGKREFNICLADRTRQASLILLKVQPNAFRHNFKNSANEKPLSKAPIYDYWEVPAILRCRSRTNLFSRKPLQGGSASLRLGVTRIVVSVKVVEVISV